LANSYFFKNTSPLDKTPPAIRLITKSGKEGRMYFLNLGTGELRVVQKARLTGKKPEGLFIWAVDKTSGEEKQEEIPAPLRVYVELQCPFCEEWHRVWYMGCECGAIPARVAPADLQFTATLLRPEDLQLVSDAIDEAHARELLGE